jgi:hypothetical protein
MSYNDIEFTFDFTPLLKTREQIKATVHFVVGGGSDFQFALFIPFVSTEPEKQVIRQILFAEGDAIAYRWALQFASAEAALDLSAYASLSQQLSTIDSPRFTIRRALVRQISPLSVRLPEKEAPKPPKQTRCEAEIADLNEAVSTLDELSKWEARSRKQHPELWGDDFSSDLMKRKIAHKKMSLLANRGAV